MEENKYMISYWKQPLPENTENITTPESMFVTAKNWEEAIKKKVRKTFGIIALRIDRIPQKEEDTFKILRE